MAPKIDTMEALTALADQEGSGLLTERGEFVMDAAMAAVVKSLAAELGGLGARSKVVRRLITKGARMELAERTARAQPAAAVPQADPEEAVREVERAKRRERDRRRREALASGSPAA
jgi:hypothetical protein